MVMMVPSMLTVNIYRVLNGDADGDEDEDARGSSPLSLELGMYYMFHVYHQS
jgi:hypothetical protein